ncbi:hypothetical protein [Inquilinus sp. CA228]|uniref:hypothetical protein n=1 Tax=Inquilinus sp. CA228 TaxID=3455609 RepID=UPI003F8D863F
MSVMPDVVTHNYDPGGLFLGNVCDLPPVEAEQVLDRIRTSGRRQIKPIYLRKRLETEAWLMAERRRLLGTTRRERPIYFFLGHFADGKDPSRPCSLVMPLDALPEDVVTFTFPDSMASLSIATCDDHRDERRPYHGRVFSLSQIMEVVAEFGVPDASWSQDHRRRFDRYVEVQVWDERPVTQFLRGPR